MLDNNIDINSSTINLNIHRNTMLYKLSEWKRKTVLTHTAISAMVCFAVTLSMTLNANRLPNGSLDA